jgi:PhzF family phenazine biosynthesis protein
MELQLYQVDTFTDELFKGNPAGVCPLDHWISDELMLSIASENNLSETAFFVKLNNAFNIRWFTPFAEVDLCGHATLASAFVIFNCMNYKNDTIIFSSRSGELIVKKQGDYLQMDFPSLKPIQCAAPAYLPEGVAKTPQHILKGADYIVVYENEEDIISINPDFLILKKVQSRGVCVTAPGNSVDFVSRFFAPGLGVNEDPVCGSAHCELVPYWADRLNKTKLSAKQLSKRGGILNCELSKDRVLISGQAKLYLDGRIKVL